MNKRTRRTLTGFTMIELIMSILLLGIIYMNVAGLFKSNQQQHTMIQTNITDTWKAYNSVVDAVYNTGQLSTTQDRITATLSTVATWDEQVYSGNKVVVDKDNSLILQRLDVKQTTRVGKTVNYTMFSINTQSATLPKQSGTTISTTGFNNYVSSHKTALWTLTNNLAWLPRATLSSGRTYFPDLSHVQSVVFLRLANPQTFNVPTNGGSRVSDTLYFSHFYYVYTEEAPLGHPASTVPYMLGTDINRYGIGLSPADNISDPTFLDAVYNTGQISYPTFLSRTVNGAELASKPSLSLPHKTSEYPVIPFRETMYYRGIAVLYDKPSGSDLVTIRLTQFKPTANAIWGDFAGSHPLSHYTYARPAGNLDPTRAANVIYYDNGQWIVGSTTQYLTSDIVELAAGNQLDWQHLYGKTVIPTNVLYELTEGKVYSVVDNNTFNIIVYYTSDINQVNASNHTLNPGNYVTTSDKQESITLPWNPSRPDKIGSYTATSVPQTQTYTYDRMVVVRGGIFDEMQIYLEVINDGISGDHHASGKGTYNILVPERRQECATCPEYYVDVCKPNLGHYSYTIKQSVTTVGATVTVTNIKIVWGGRDRWGKPSSIFGGIENLSNLKDKNNKPLQIVLYAKGNGANKGKNKGKLVFDYGRSVVGEDFDYVVGVGEDTYTHLFKKRDVLHLYVRKMQHTLEPYVEYDLTFKVETFAKISNDINVSFSSDRFCGGSSQKGIINSITKPYGGSNGMISKPTTVKFKVNVDGDSRYVSWGNIDLPITSPEMTVGAAVASNPKYLTLYNIVGKPSEGEQGVGNWTGWYSNDNIIVSGNTKIILESLRDSVDTKYSTKVGNDYITYTPIQVRNTAIKQTTGQEKYAFFKGMAPAVRVFGYPSSRNIGHLVYVSLYPLPYWDFTSTSFTATIYTTNFPGYTQNYYSPVRPLPFR